MNKKFIILITILIFFFIFFIFYLSLNNSGVYKPDQHSKIKVVSFKSNDLFSNDEYDFKDLLNEKKFTVINIWASWCAPCRLEHKFLLKLKNYNNVNLIGLNYKDKISNAKNFLNKYDNPYSIVLKDNDGTKSIELGAYGVPETYIISNKEKLIIKKYVGPLNQKKFSEIINLIKNEKL